MSKLEERHGWLMAATVLLLVATVIASVVRASSGTGSAAPSVSTSVPAAGGGVTAFGVLAAQPDELRQDQAAGVRLVTLGVGWDQWEPSQGQFDASYVKRMRAEADRYRAAGMRVAIDPGLQYPPGWVAALPNGRLLDQQGKAATVADFAWSQAVRSAAGAYLANLVASLGPVVDYRVGLSENGETLYPDTSSNQWWAYARSGQGVAGGLPAGLSPSPMPGWVPGTPTWRGQPVTVTQATAWYDWYLSGSASALAWEIATYRAAGYTGQLELVTPGTGSLPAFYHQRLSNLLADGTAAGQHYDDLYTLNTAAVWWKLLDTLPDLHGVAVDISSMDDGSGNPRANGCTPADRSVAVTDQRIWSWSDTRWLTYLANLHHLPVLAENPGGTPASELDHITNLLSTCHVQALQWAFDKDLDGHGGSADREQVSRALAQTQTAERSAAGG